MSRLLPVFVWLQTSLLCSLIGPHVSASELTIVLSSEATPYQESALHLQSLYPKSNIILASELVVDESGAHKHVAIGSQAAAVLHGKLSKEQALYYCMVHEPQKIGLSERHAIGVRTDVPMRTYIETIKQVMPNVQRIGLLYWGQEHESPAHLIALRAAAKSGAAAEIKAVSVSRQRDVARAVKKVLLLNIDVLLIVPDKQLISSSMLRTVLRKSIDAGIPVCAYSSGCVKAGASFGVHITPQQQAQQLADVMEHFVEYKRAPQSAQVVNRHTFMFPTYQIAINQSVVKRIQLHIPDEVLTDAINLGAAP